MNLFFGIFSSRRQPIRKVRAPQSRLVLEALEDRTLLSGNPIVAENQLPGTPQSVWGVSGAGDPSILGFATDISVNHGQTESFKIDDYANAPYHIDIYRMGYYQGNGARLVATLSQSQVTRQVQPAPLTDNTTGLVDAGNWAVSASWAVPATAVSGIYMARATRDDTGGASLIYFVVRADESTSDLLFQTSDSTWQAYNNWDGKGNGNTTYFGTGGAYGGVSLYTYNGSNTTLSAFGRANAVSYNRPLVDDATSGGYGDYNAPLHGEYPMVRWLEANGYDVSYTTDVDSARYGSLILNHKTFLSVGHDEYWSGPQRANVKAARDGGVNLAFFSGNESFWKTRWQASIDSSATAYRTLVCYKQSYGTGPADPLDSAPTWTWTGTWRDANGGPPADGHLPENAMSGTMYMADRTNVELGIPLNVPAADANLRFWRNTSVARLQAGQTATLGQYLVGYEVDEDLDNGFRPAGLFDMSSTTFSSTSAVIDQSGTQVGSGTLTHSITLYRAPSGALVFGAGTVQWSWGLDGNHSDGTTTPDPAIQQATVNLLADMNAQPATLQSGLVAATASTDKTPPTSMITSPAAGASIQSGTTVTITGTATDAGGGVVTAVEVSTDGGATWHRAVGQTAWSYTWSPNGLGPVTLKSRAVDDSGNLEAPSAGVTVNVAGPISIWSKATVPTVVADGDTSSTELGVKFRSDVAAYVLGIRFYKGSTNTGTHVGSLWNSTGTLLAQATFTNETASGWQQVLFASPVAIAPNTTYVASYHAPNGRYSEDDGYFNGAGVSNGPLHGLAAGVDGPNGVYAYGSTSLFPTNNYQSANYYVDVVYNTTATDTTPPTVTGETPAPNATSVATGTAVTAKFSESIQPSTLSFVLKDPGGNVVPATVTYTDSQLTATLTPSSPLGNSMTYTATVSGAKDLAGNTMSSFSWSFTTTAPLGTGPYSIWPSTATPVTPDDPDTSSTELGVKFRADVAGTITGVRFYKGPTDTGTHVGSLWSSTGTLLAQATFTNETASGWQQVTFSSPVAIQPNTTYVASYHAPNGQYAEDDNYFAASGVDNYPLHALAAGVDGPNGVYAYGSTSLFPTNNYQSANYWVDVLFKPNQTNTTPPTVTTPTQANITTTSATLGGNVTSDGGAAIIERGIVYSLTSANADPLLGGSGVTKVTTTGTTGVFTVNVSGLTSSSGYSYKAYATNAQGTSYTSVDTFTTATAASAPTVTSPTATSITDKTATLGGNVTSDGGAAISERGIVYSLTSANSNPIIGGSGVTKVTAAGTTGVFSIGVTGLTASSGYSYKAYATNSVGTTYTSVATFTTAAPATAPTVTGLNPASGPTTGGTSVILTGTGFTGATAVTFGGTAATGFVVNSDTQITATAPAHTFGTVDVTVTTPNGTSATSSADQFKYVPPSGINLAPNGTAFRWFGMSSATANTNKTAATGLNDNNLTNDVPLTGGGDDVANAYEAAGVIWSPQQSVSISKVTFTNGSFNSGSYDGVFDNNLTLQYTLDGTTWQTASGWTLSPTYAYNLSSAANQTYTFTGTSLNNILGVRVVGRVHSRSGNDSWYANVTEIQAFNITTPSSTNIRSSSNPISAGDQILTNFALLPSNTGNAYESELSSVAALWQSADALALQRLDALLSVEAGAMGMSKDTLMRDLLFARMSSANG